MSALFYNTTEFLKRRSFLIFFEGKKHIKLVEYGLPCFYGQTESRRNIANLCEILWISVVIFAFYETFTCYSGERKFYHIRKILGLGLCISRGTATVINICCALVLIPLCKKLNQVFYRLLSKLWPGLFFFWLERAKSFHMIVAITLVLFSVIHSISHLVNMWNFSRSFDEKTKEVNFANYKNQNPFWLLFSQAGGTGVAMLVITIAMSMTSLRVVRRRVYNAFWYTHQLYVPFFIMLIIHPLGGVLKEEVLEESDASLVYNKIENWNNDTLTIHTPRFIPIKSKNWLWMIVPLSCYLLDMIWRIISRNSAGVHIIKATHMAGRVISLILSCPHEQFTCRMGQYMLLQCHDVSLLEWHPFTVVKIPTPTHRELCVWIRVKGDWTESLEKLLIERGPRQLSMSVDGPFSSPMQAVARSRVCVCVAAGVGITPFVSIMHHMLMNPRSHKPGRMHLLWIVRYEHEITWIANLATNLINHLRYSNRPDRFHLELYVTNTSKIVEEDKIDLKNHVVVINEKGILKHVTNNDRRYKDNEKTTLLTPNMNRTNANRRNKSDIEVHQDNNFDLSKQFPILGCRVKRGRPHWDKVFGYWVHLYPGESLNLYCCGPKNLVNLLRLKCKVATRTTKTKFTFVHEGFG